MKIRLDSKKDWVEVGEINKIMSLTEGSEGAVLYTRGGVEVFLTKLDIRRFEERYPHDPLLP